MSRLKTVGSRIQSAPRRQLGSTDVSERRITGRALQDRRLRIWSRDPRCAHCGKLVSYPEGFELDHVIPLFRGGQDTDDNCQVLCVEYIIKDGQQVKVGCHSTKTVQDLK